MNTEHGKWWDVSWSPISGCTPIAAGCKNCWARRQANRKMAGYDYPEPFKVRLHLERFDQPLHWRKPRVVAVCLMGDLFHTAVPRFHIREVFTIMRMCTTHTFLVLTKRPKRMAELCAEKTTLGCVCDNIWLGTSVSVQKDVDAAVEPMSRLAAAGWKTWVSVEPLLERVDLGGLLPHRRQVIVGGESGPGARWMGTDWVRGIRHGCKRTATPFFFKQWSGVNVKKLGRELDGREHNDLAWRSDDT